MRYTKMVMQGIWLVVFYWFLSTVPALAVEKIDTEFGNNGFAVKDFGLGDDEALSLVVQPDGKLLVAGYSDNGAVKNITVARYLPSGLLDISFNYDGVFSDSPGSGDSIALSVAVQDDGRILVAGSSFDMGPRLAVIALTEDGYLDSGFGDNGKVILPVQDEAIIAADLKIAADGSAIVAATVENSDSSRYPLFVKVGSDGEFASDFGEGGVVLQEADHSVEVHGLALLDEGRILVAGSIERDEIVQAGLLRRNADGTPDTTFGNEGELILEIEGVSSVINDLLVEPGGSVLLAGSVKDENFSKAFAARLMEDGELDPYFAGNGLFKSNLDYDNAAYGIAVQPDQTVVLAGSATSGQGKDVIVWSFPGNKVPTLSNEDEVILDSEQQIVLRGLSLSDSNIEQIDSEADVLAGQLSDNVAVSVVTDIADGDDTSYAAVALASGQVVVAGSSGNGTDKDFALVGYTSEDISGGLLSESSARGVKTGDLRVITRPVEDITRIGAVSGGNIYLTTSLSCKTSCGAQCTDSLDNDENTESGCSNFNYAICLSVCEEARTIIKRGVVYSVYPYPSYRSGEEATDLTETPVDSDSNSFMYETVRSGQTEDGIGVGVYGSDMQEITPNVTYYVRAYGITADGTIIYGNQLTFKTEDACFIATAAYGTLLDRHVVLLREFRDIYLMPNSIGRKIVSIYYRFSPELADIVSSNMMLRGVVQIALWPLVAFALFMLKATSVVKFTFMIIILLTAGMYLRLTTGNKNCQSGCEE